VEAALYETAARAQKILSLDIEDPDRVRAGPPAPPCRRRLLKGRTAGPVFLADRRAPTAGTRALAATDVCPVTGRGRLSYPRAEYLFKSATADLDPRGRG
jgi:hypothetical protein